MQEKPRVLIVTKGHPFDHEAFFAVFEDPLFTAMDFTHLEHPEVQDVLTADGTAGYDALLMYDMPGIGFTGDDPPVLFDEPRAEFTRGYLDMLDAGRGMVFLHHAVASWPAWPEFAGIVGGRFHYQPADLAGRSWPDSGYVFDVQHTVEVLEPDHPITAGLDTSFDIVDELYLFPVFEEDVVPLMRSRYDFSDSNFFSADLAIRGTRNSNDGWSHPPGSNLVCWVKHAGNSPVAYIQFGDGPKTYEDPNYRRVVANAIRWAASTGADQWARERNAGL